MSAPDHLIIVCCHGIWTGGPERGHHESEWLIAPFQVGETPFFIDHIKTGLRALAADERAVLMFSGGPTRKETQLSEAKSYANLAAANHYFGILTQSHETSHILCEEKALDSYSNVVQSLALFWHHYARWPSHINIVSHAFKRQRFLELHCRAIGFPLDRVAYPVRPEDDPAGAESSPGVTEAVSQWAADPHGTAEPLSAKRRRRNPWSVSQMLFDTEDERARSGIRSQLTATNPVEECLLPQEEQPWSITNADQDRE